MLFLRNSDSDANEQQPTESQPTAQPHPEAAPDANTSAAWWQSSDPAPDAAPPTNQSAEVRIAVTEPFAREVVAPATDAATPEEESESLAPVAVAATPPRLAEGEQEAEDAVAEVEAKTESTGSDFITEGTRQLSAASAPALSSCSSRQGLAATAMRDVGRLREMNQDSVFALLTSLPREGGDIPVGLFVVADGMGGHEGGEVASRLAVRTVAHYILAQLVLPALDGTMESALQPMMVCAVQAANEAIWDSAQVTGSDMGTTCTAALLVGGSLYIAHVGDSRAYLFEPGGLRQLTTDHSTVGRLIQLGQLEPHEAREHPLRSQLYRTIGQQPQVMVDFIYQPLGASSHLLLCSDGLWGMVEEPLLQQALTRCIWPQDACHELIALANLAGGEDNIAAVVVSLPMVER
ncbi:MAG: serine/threonine-protein phosphatase [Candidatus Viridilinea halotolerans]|uniref:Serine/threonine-protein phosphatase n=1 Tax=Candidatus Viridilinea halotolerans TaxID=2491704 RepID=A0A426TYP7_9CHLR|nr:MAG: serine/threonine-protein phosphatase [Candidatus Viridilinea halotolerans]